VIAILQLPAFGRRNRLKSLKT